MAPATVNYPELSSPDPLADPYMEEYASQSSPRKNAATKTNKRGQRTRRSGDLILSSSGVNVDQHTSPWRIKVTVEAEHEGDSDAISGAGRRQTITRTIKVPLRDASSPTKPSTKNGRTNKSRDGTQDASPARKTRNRRSLTNLDMVVLGDDTEDDEWKAPAKSPRKGRPNKLKSARRSGSASRGASSMVSLIEDDLDTVADERKIEAHPSDNDRPEMEPVDLNQVALMARPAPARRANRRDHGQEENMRKVSTNSTRSYPSPSPSASEYGDLEENQPNVPDENEIGLDTVMESEGFTMIDLESLPSVRHMRQTPEYPTIAEEVDDESFVFKDAAQKEPDTMEAPSIQLSTLSEETTDLSNDFQSSPPGPGNRGSKKAYSIGHLQLPSSTNVQRHRHVTPMPSVSPSIPSPPRAPTSASKERSPANSEKAVVAAQVLQGAVTPEHSALSDHFQDPVVHDHEEQTFFGGFSSSTRRELRAELRFGEELGKKQSVGSSDIQDIPTEKMHRPLASSYTQVWRGENTVQRTPPVISELHKKHTDNGDLRNVRESSDPSADVRHEKSYESRIRKEREQVIEQVKGADRAKVIVVDDDSDVATEDVQEDEEEVEETMGDIWLAEARNHSSSPRDTVQERLAEPSEEKPRRRLIPSPWKRGEQIDTNTTSHLSGNESFTGIFSRPSVHTASRGFGAAIVANPERASRQMSDHDRRRTGEAIDGEVAGRLTHRSALIREECTGSQDFGAGDIDGIPDRLEWRDASDVVEEETSLFEAEHDLGVAADHHLDGPAGATTHLYETNLDELSDQDLSSSPHIQLTKKHRITIGEHDSTYSSLSEGSVDDKHRQRTSLSPSKERPKTPKSALKGTRASFGAVLGCGTDSEEANNKKVVWSKRMSCMNEEWEESSRSIRSTQESFQDDTPTPLTIEKPLSQARERQSSAEDSRSVSVQQPSKNTSGKGWFGWLRPSSDTAKSQNDQSTSEKVSTTSVSNLDGSMDEFIRHDCDPDDGDSSYAPTSRHTSTAREPVTTRTQASPPTDPETKRSPRQVTLPQRNNSPDLTKVPSYLQPPSYPSDPARDTSIPLSTSGNFSKSHFKTLHIIYRKSLRPRFHAPSYPEEIRSELRALVENDWTLAVDESDAMDDVFEFKIGIQQAQILERFMREVEHGHRGSKTAVAWGWTAGELAGNLGRIAIGEVVREEEKETKRIMGRVKTGM